VLQAVIFDMDGLLIDSEPIWRKSHIEALDEYGIIITEDDVRAMAGRRTDEVVSHWKENHPLGHVHNKALEEDVISRVIKGIHVNGAELPGVRHVISLFESRDITMAVASSSSPEIIETVLKKLSLAQHMKLTYSAKYEEFGKPHPGVFLTTARKLGVEPTNCLVLEDSLSGVKAAKAAGMKCIAVPEAENLHKSEFGVWADVIVASLEKIDWKTIDRLF
jgi:beta-phosphoglucomutase-like phosphatase (HAD superfamily)